MSRRVKIDNKRLQLDSKPFKTKRKRSSNEVAAKDLKRKKLEAKSKWNSLHALSLSKCPWKQALAVSTIERENDLHYEDAKGNTLLHVAVKHEAFYIIEALLKKTNHAYFLDPKYENTLALAMRSPNADKLLRLFFSRLECLHVTNQIQMTSCQVLPWDMSDDHLVAVVKTLVQLLGRTDSCAVQELLEFVSSRNRELVKLLFKCRINANERLINLQTLLSYKFVLKDRTLVTFLIREGANINDCVNDIKQYPLHLACNNALLGTAQWMLQLGADANVTDQQGNTPLSLIFHSMHSLHFLDTARLMIKHFACLTSAGKKVNGKDLSAIRSQPDSRTFYESCLEQLNEMKTVEAADGFLYYYFFSKTNYDLSLLLKNPSIAGQLRKRLLQFELEIFPVFRVDMMTKFGVTRQMSQAIVSRERELEEAFGEILPCIALYRIARYSLDLINFEKEYHLKKFS